MKILTGLLLGLVAITSNASDVAMPRVYFAASGPAEYTYGPRCGNGIEATDSSYFRITAPPEWQYTGGGGGSGADYLLFNIGKQRVQVDVYANAQEFKIERDFEDHGPTGISADLGGTTVPIHKVALKGRTGHGILGFRWLEHSAPRQDYEGTVLITSRKSDALSPEQAAQVLGTVRAERCAVVREMLIPYVDRKLHLPTFVGGDPLGKNRPEEEPPLFTPPTSPLLLWTEAQIAYLLPLDEKRSACVAPLVRADAESNRMLHLQVLAPTGTHKKVLAEYVAQCDE